jgi:hypothetical protein
VNSLITYSDLTTEEVTVKDKGKKAAFLAARKKAQKKGRALISFTLIKEK